MTRELIRVLLGLWQWAWLEFVSIAWATSIICTLIGDERMKEIANPMQTSIGRWLRNSNMPLPCLSSSAFFSFDRSSETQHKVVKHDIYSHYMITWYYHFFVCVLSWFKNLNMSVSKKGMPMSMQPFTI